MLKEWCSGPAPPPPSLFETQYRALSEFKIEGCSAKSKEREREKGEFRQRVCLVKCNLVSMLEFVIHLSCCCALDLT